ncbi:MAG TPA: hypothetical protein PLD88_08035, partial [Candidatus Berkiella sp.]|nr:hypothetical protein [Candidatus Berkiella sp.]
MSDIVTTFESYIKKLEIFQNHDELKKNKTDLALLEDILSHLKKAIKDKKDDWQIAYMDIIDVQYKCVPFPKNPQLTRVTYDELVSFCETHTRRRKNLSHQILEYIIQIKTSKTKKHHLSSKLSGLLTFLFGNNFQTMILNNKFETLVAELVKSKTLSNIELRNWIFCFKRTASQEWQDSLGEALSLIPKNHF